MRYLIWGGIILQVVGYAGFAGQALATQIQCTVETAATRSLCVNSLKVAYIQAVFSVVTDFYILILPIRVVAKLQMSWRRKLGVLTVFMIGLLSALRGQPPTTLRY